MSPERRTPGWVPALIGVGAFLLVTVVGGLIAVDWAWRNVEMDALVSAVEASEDAMTRTQRDLAQQAQALQGVAKPTDDDKAAMLAAIADAGARGEARVGRAGDLVSQVAVAPWHLAIVDAKAAYVAHNASWQDYLGAIAGDPKVYGTDQPVIDATFMASEPLMRAAVPVPDLFTLAPRVDRIYVEGAPQPSAPDGEEVVLRTVLARR